jgi:hypothetical protein
MVSQVEGGELEELLERMEVEKAGGKEDEGVTAMVKNVAP